MEDLKWHLIRINQSKDRINFDPVLGLNQWYHILHHEVSSIIMWAKYSNIGWLIYSWIIIQVVDRVKVKSQSLHWQYIKGPVFRAGPLDIWWGGCVNPKKNIEQALIVTKKYRAGQMRTKKISSTPSKFPPSWLSEVSPPQGLLKKLTWIHNI